MITHKDFHENGVSTHSTRALVVFRAKIRGEHLEFLVGKRKVLPYLAVSTASKGVPVFIPRPCASGTERVTSKGKEVAAFANLSCWGEQAIGLFGKGDLKKADSPVMKGVQAYLNGSKSCPIPDENLVSGNSAQVPQGLKTLFEGDVAVSPIMTPALTAYFVERVTQIVSMRESARQNADGKGRRPFIHNIALFSMGAMGLGGSNGHNVGFPQKLFEQSGPGSYGFMLYSKHPGTKRSGEHRRLIWRMALSSEPFVPSSFADKWHKALKDAIAHAFLANGSKPFNASMNDWFIERLEALATDIAGDTSLITKKLRASIPCGKANNDFVRNLVCPAHELSEQVRAFDMGMFLSETAIKELPNSVTFKVDKLSHVKEMLADFIKEKLS